jgi:hypothetical protein
MLEPITRSIDVSVFLLYFGQMTVTIGLIDLIHRSEVHSPGWYRLQNILNLQLFGFSIPRLDCAGG